MFDIISIPMLKPLPHTYQSENHLIANRYFWQRLGTASWAQIKALVDDVTGELWWNGGDKNDRVPEQEASQLKGSLLLIDPRNLRIRVEGADAVTTTGKRRVRALFSLNGIPYNLGLTDAAMEQEFLRGRDGEFAIADALLCVSLGEPFNGYAFKLAAGLLTADRLGISE